jgi:CO dehydrogenase/acetyl-CoA synthase beta subunit
MDLFEKHISLIRGFLNEKRTAGALRELACTDAGAWPRGGGRNVVLGQDMELELGNPRQESVSFMIWTDDPSKVRDGIVSLIGPDIPEAAGKSLPFGKIVIAGVSGFNAENSYDRYREMESVRHELDLRGYMLRAASQYGREWSRVSREAVANGFRFATLAGELLAGLRGKEYVRSAEIIIITSSTEDVRRFTAAADEVMRITGAMNKMLAELSLDCDTCGYQDVCAETGELKTMHDELKKKGGIRRVN